MADRPMIQVLDACDTGRHVLKPRYDFAKVVDIVERKYVCDVCTICGHQVPRPFTVQEQLETGVISPEEVRGAFAALAENGLGEENLSHAIGSLILAQMKSDP